PPAVWLVWLAERDSPVVQDFVGVLRGRRSRSSRNESTETAAEKAAVAAEAARKENANRAKRRKKAAGPAPVSRVQAAKNRVAKQRRLAGKKKRR
ncbi:MAG: hypothetical protein Q4C71_05170, partial [Microbacteriaceae bacterium]|nr:hypothetical protein [Microbacteriaceae bacterium]